MNRKIGYILFLIPLVLLIAFGWCRNTKHEIDRDISWPVIKTEHKPGIYWWWMGSAVDKENLTYNLELLHDAGIGCVTIVPIYGVKGNEKDYIDYLTPIWMEMLSHTVKEAQRLNMWVDMSTGTGWPFGGSHIESKHAANKVVFKVYELSQGERFEQELDHDGLQVIKAYGSNNIVIDLQDYLEENNVLRWTAPPGEWKICIVCCKGTGQKVKRAAPGNLGYVVDPFSVASLIFYLERFDRAFNYFEGTLPRAQYHDSYEYYNANWTTDFFDQFKILRGYDLLKYLPFLFDHGDKDAVSRVKADYRHTLSELHLAYIQQWHNWAHEKGCITREQAHGAPANLLDLYATADIPETEIFGSTAFNIPGLRRDAQNIAKDEPNPLILQFASSAAHVSGRRLVASETCTWLREHYKVALSQVKPEIDQLFVSGINHIFYHGNAYTPVGVEWPGWLFYASTHFEAENAIWRNFPELNNYVTRCQSILQTGEPANDILLYWPIHDLWYQSDQLLQQLSVHDASWFSHSPFGQLANILRKDGYTFDYISDHQVQNVRCVDGRIHSGITFYRALVIPECNFIPLNTWTQLLKLAQQGAKIIVYQKLPADVPGYFNLQQRREKLRKVSQKLLFSKLDTFDVKSAKTGQGEILIGNSISDMLKMIDINREKLVDSGLNFIRRKYSKGYYYFITNLSQKGVDDWIPMAIPFQSAAILDPLSAQKGMAAVRQNNGKTEIYLQLQPGESLILKTFTSQKIKDQPYRYYYKSDKSYRITGKWQVDFIHGGPTLPGSFSTEALTSWTKIGDEEAQRFAGTASYSIDFFLPDIAADAWMLQLGRVCESARVRINGKEAGTSWSIPFNLLVGQFLQKGKNKLEIEVTNLSANRIADLDRRKVEWKKFHDINFVNINYQPFDSSDWILMESGLLGSVTLVPLNLINFML